MLVDTHCHLQLLDYAQLGQTMPATVQRALDNQVTELLCVATKFTDTAELARIAREFSNVKISTGLHPNEAIDQEPTTVDIIQAALKAQAVAIGETGLDYFRTTETGAINLQQLRFKNHIAAAKELNLPLIVHTRQARADTVSMLHNEDAAATGGVIHCFSENWEMAKACLDLGFYISFSGIVTFKNAKELQEVARQVPLEKMLIETDCPYLAPMPNRGKINQPAYLKHTAAFLAELKGISFEQLAQATTQNYMKLFIKR